MLNPTVLKTTWDYPLLEVTQDKSTMRPGVKKPDMAELIGFDGSVRGGLGPSPGFKRVYDLDFWDDPNHDGSSVITDHQPVHFNIGAEGYGFGIVYRARRSSLAGAQGRADVFVDFWNSNTDPVGTFGTVGLKVAHDVDPDEPMSVVVFGQCVYIWIRGRVPAEFFVEEVPSDDSSTTTSTSTSSSGCPDEIVGSPTYVVRHFGLNCEDDNQVGPGKQPFLKSPDESVPLGSLDLPVPAANNRPGHAQIVLTSIAPTDNPFLLTGSSTTTTSTSSSEGSSLRGRKLEPGDYTFGYFLFDSKTGRRSALSEIAQCRKEDFDEASGTTVASQEELYAALEVIYDSGKFDQMYVYRSLRIQDIGSEVLAANIHLDKIIDLEDFQTTRNGAGQDFDPANTDNRHAIYYYQFEDKQLTVQLIYLGQAYVDEAPPRGGAAIYYQGSMMVGNIHGRGVSTTDGNRLGDAFRGLGETRWSSLEEYSPELFPPANRYYPKVPSSTVQVFQQIGVNVIGFAKDRVQHFHKENIFIKGDDTHEGYGIVGPKAAVVVGSEVFYLGRRGLLSLKENAQLDEVRGLDVLVQKQWTGSLENVSLSYDPKGQIAFIHNPDVKHTALLWFRTARTTELLDVPFTETRRGWWPVDPDDYSSRLEDRATFLLNPPADTIDVKPRIYLFDVDEERVISGSNSFDGQKRVTLLDFTGDSRFDVELVADEFLTLDDTDLTLGDGLEGAYVYVIDSTDKAYIGRKAQIKQKAAGDTVELTQETFAEFTGLPVGSRVAMSPIYMRLVGYNVGPEINGQPIAEASDKITQKLMSGMACAFTDVSGPPSTDGSNDNRFRALAYKGSSQTPLDAVFIKDANGDKAASVVDGPSKVMAAYGQETPLVGAFAVSGGSLSPGIEIICPDLDFELLEMAVSGSILSSTREERE